MTQVQSLPGQTSLLPAEQPPRPPTVKALLKEFAKQPGCDAYDTDGERITLLTHYLWLRQLTPALPFETFLRLFAPLADYNEENCKHPEDAIKFHCPRRAKGLADGEHQWTAAEVVAFMSLYVDAIREAERVQQPVPLSFDAFLGALKPQFLAGAFVDQEPEPAATEKPKRKSAAANASVTVRPTAAGQRVMYTMASDNDRQIRGTVEAITRDNEREYVTFVADGGERHTDVAMNHCQVIDDKPVQPVMDAAGQPLQVGARQTLTIPKSVFPGVKAALAMTAPLGNVAIGDSVHSFEAGFGDTYAALVEVINGESGPYVDARLIRVTDSHILDELQPRKNIDGHYLFKADQSMLDLEIKVRE